MIMLLGYVAIAPWLFCANLALIAVVIAFSTVIAKRDRFTARVGIAIVLVLSAGWWVVFITFTGVKREMAFDMEWSYGEKSASYPTADNIVLRFKSHPNHYVGIYSTDLGKYLESLPSHNVRVVFEVTLDFGRTRGFREIQIGELKSWNDQDGYSGGNGNSQPSPWP